MSRGPYKKNDTFDGEVLIDHFKEFLKVYLEPADESVITYKEMLEAIEKTLIWPMLSNSFAENQKLKLEDLPSLKESSFDHIFESFNLSIAHMKSHAILDAGIQEFFKANAYSKLPKIQHPLLDELREAENSNSDSIEEDSVDNTVKTNPLKRTHSAEILENTHVEDNNSSNNISQN
ncbi:hypothetical protein CANINC_001954 [Pichia inconspicua]|uniref:Uncharacterized protein n=1 Tax=Pichia inconspicua TaxID=52247 RepID=A0A4T0X405_9ASCO|nr:hypothetical protein CANINC_001954 [[Candida] inconspicua]